MKAKEQLTDEDDNTSNSLHQSSSVSQDVSNLKKTSVSCREIRWQVPEEMPCLKHPKLHYVFTKHVKPKKQHEISKMAQV
jgi:hypothetical protein